MASEFRQVVFGNEELRLALEEYFAGPDERLPRGRIVSATITEDELNIELATEESLSGRRPARVPAEHVAAALIGLCRKRGIPLPRGSKKYIVVAGDNLALRIVMKQERLIEIIEDAS